MVERRPLTEGIKAATPAPVVDAVKEKEFVYGTKPTMSEPKPTTRAPEVLSRVPISTRIRSDFSAALKRASLERQLHGVQPNTLQDILEEAIEPWLKSNGYLR